MTRARGVRSATSRRHRRSPNEGHEWEGSHERSGAPRSESGDGMSKPRGGLGRGLGALIPTTPTAPTARVLADGTDGASEVSEVDLGLSPVPGARFAEVAVDSIVPNPKQPRTVFDEEALTELKASIDEVGFLQPIVVREVGPQKY